MFVLPLTTATAGFETLCGHTHKMICRETERATTDLNIKMKSSRRGASTGGAQKFIFFESYFYVNNTDNMPYFFVKHSWMRLVENSNTEVSGASEVPQSRDKLFF